VAHNEGGPSWSRNLGVEGTAAWEAEWGREAGRWAAPEGGA
jgi:hypothetical protein